MPPRRPQRTYQNSDLQLPKGGLLLLLPLVVFAVLTIGVAVWTGDKKIVGEATRLRQSVVNSTSSGKH